MLTTLRSHLVGVFLGPASSGFGLFTVGGNTVEMGVQVLLTVSLAGLTDDFRHTPQ